MSEYSTTQYRTRSVTTMTPVEVIIRLYSEIERQLAIGVEILSDKESMAKNLVRSNEAFQKAENCIDALRESLDMTIPISHELEVLYIYFYKEIVKANGTKDCTNVKKIIPMIADLRDAFTKISQMTKEEIDEQERENRRREQEQAEAEAAESAT